MKYNVKLGNFFEKYEKIGGSTDINNEYKSGTPCSTHGCGVSPPLNPEYHSANVYKIPSMNSYNIIGGGKKKKRNAKQKEKEKRKKQHFL